MKLLLGFAGEQLAGKETAAKKIEELLARDGYTVRSHRFSDVLRETLTLWDIPHGRENEQLIARVIAAPEAFREDALSRAIKARLLKDTADVGILDGVRWLSDEQIIRDIVKSGVKPLMIYITADFDTRFARLIARNRAGEAQTTHEAFTAQNSARNEIDIPEIGSRADIRIENNGSVEAFLRSIEIMYEKKIKPLLAAL